MSKKGHIAVSVTMNIAVIAIFTWLFASAGIPWDEALTFIACMFGTGALAFFTGAVIAVLTHQSS